MRFMRHEAWSDALFIHYPVDASALQRRLPNGLLVDQHNGVAYVGVVLLTESGIVPQPSHVPHWLVRWLGLSHHAVNVRTYVRPALSDAGPPGIYFFSLECSGMLPTIGARLLFNLPYQYAEMSRTCRQTGAMALKSSRRTAEAKIEVEWVAEGPVLCGNAGVEGDVSDLENDAALGRFFVERYALYNVPGPLLRLLMPSGSRLWSGTITHEPWPLRKARLIAYGGICSSVGVLSAAGLADLVLGGKPMVHASRGVGPISFYWHGRAA